MQCRKESEKMRVLLIPSAKMISSEMRKQLGEIPTVLYPLGEKTMLEQLCSAYTPLVDAIYVVTYEKQHLIENFVNWKKLNVILVALDHLDDLGYTVRCGLKRIFEDIPNVSTVYINYADTLLNNEAVPDAKDVVYYQMTELNSTWTFFTQQDGEITSIQDKFVSQTEKDGCEMPFFAGVFQLSTPRDFMECLNGLYGKEHSVDLMYLALKKYSKMHKLQFCAANDWIDVGHSENYLQAKTSVAAREFNSIVIDKNRGTLKKYSKNVDKFLGEINWYVKIPQNLQYLLPRIYSYSVDRSSPFVEMEYYGYHTLHELLVFGNPPLIQWQRIFWKLRFVTNDMKRFIVSDSDEIKQAMREIYINKTENRLRSLEYTEQFKDFFQRAIVVNGDVYPNLTEILDKLPKWCQTYVIDGFDGKFSIIHGDLCFSNILIEENDCFLRLIDPRGAFGSFDIYGDPRYDLAKIAHSLEGRYDYIIEDMFNVEQKGTSIVVTLPDKGQQIFDVFCETFDISDEEINAIRFIEATLFLSMIPLHSDHPDRQLAMLSVGLQLLKKVCKKL